MDNTQHKVTASPRLNDPLGPSSPGLLRRRAWLAGVAALAGTAAIGRVHADELAHDHHDHGAHAAHKAQMANAGQTPASAASAARGRSVTYSAPAVTMLDQFGRKVSFKAALDDGRPVILNFVFTSCATVCPVMSQIFAQVQSRLGSELDKVHMVSVSIDPEYDTPARLLAYGRQYGAGPQWDFYTGSIEASTQVQQAFDAYRGDKMNHEAAVLLRGRRGSRWMRLDGFATADAIVKAYRTVAS
jgi:protein SCO1/2